MITFCIPIYNQDVNALVDEIVRQSESIDLEFQILCFDDQSNPKFKALNKDLGLKLNVNYTELSENVGRAKIRNKMARLARYNFMVFLDGDSSIENESFVSNYADLVRKRHVVYGGRNYPKSNDELNKTLHYNYGRKVESSKLSKRLKNRYTSFMSNNFLVSAKVMKEFPFDESMTSYGYEDLEWAERLNKANVLIHHIDNATIHLGIETNENFVNKIDTSIINLVKLAKEKKITRSRLLKSYGQIKALGLEKFMANWISKNGESIKDKLINNKAGLITLQIYKLALFAKVWNSTNQN